ncbi:MAG TPA: YaiI/YqxD family protein [Atopostipes sp.]|nr:YaiI/YqxD family protein [Atopostipes sp.]
MKIIIDADASPVKNEVIQLAGEHDLSVVLVSSIAHYSFEEHPEYVKVVYVEKGADRADFKIVQLAEKNDIVVTQDYGLASLLLPKGCHVIHHKGYAYTKENIDQLLQSRHISAMQRKSGGRTKGPSPFTDADREKFLQFFTEVLENMDKK